MNTNACTISIDADAAAVCDELDSFLKELTEFSGSVTQLSVDRFNDLIELGCIDVEDIPATGTRDSFLLFKLSNSFSDFIAAFRAGDLSADGI